MRRYWSAEELAYLDAEFPHRETSEICDHLDRREAQVDGQARARGLKKTPEMRSRIAKRLADLRQNDPAVRSAQFKSGCVPWNKKATAPVQEVVLVPTLYGVKTVTRANGATVTQHRMRG